MLRLWPKGATMRYLLALTALIAGILATPLAKAQNGLGADTPPQRRPAATPQSGQAYDDWFGPATVESVPREAPGFTKQWADPDHVYRIYKTGPRISSSGKDWSEWYEISAGPDTARAGYRIGSVEFRLYR